MHRCMCLNVDVQRLWTRHAVCSVSNLTAARSVLALRKTLPSKAHTASGGIVFRVYVFGTVHIGERFLSWGNFWVNSLGEKPAY